jgi:hypothetical protein
VLTIDPNLPVVVATVVILIIVTVIHLILFMVRNLHIDSSTRIVATRCHRRRHRHHRAIMNNSSHGPSSMIQEEKKDGIGYRPTTSSFSCPPSSPQKSQAAAQQHFQPHFQPAPARRTAPERCQSPLFKNMNPLFQLSASTTTIHNNENKSGYRTTALLLLGDLVLPTRMMTRTATTPTIVLLRLVVAVISEAWSITLAIVGVRLPFAVANGRWLATTTIMRQRRQRLQ